MIRIVGKDKTVINEGTTELSIIASGGLYQSIEKYTKTAVVTISDLGSGKPQNCNVVKAANGVSFKNSEFSLTLEGDRYHILLSDGYKSTLQISSLLLKNRMLVVETTRGRPTLINLY